MDRTFWIRRAVDAALGLLVVGLLWSVNAAFLHFGGIYPAGTERPIGLSVTADDLGVTQWRIGAINYKEDQQAYQVALVDGRDLELLRLTVKNRGDRGPQADTDRGRAGAGGDRGRLTIEEVRAQVVAMLPQLEIGAPRWRSDKPFARAAVLHNGRELGYVRLNPATGGSFDPSAGGAGRNKMRQARWIPNALVMPLGWAGGGLVLGATLYYGWRRSLYLQLRIAETAREQGLALLRRTLDRHCLWTAIGAGVIAVHTVNHWSGISWTLGWTALGLAALVSLSGVIGRYAMDRAWVQVAWRRFHRPAVALFFVALALHAAGELF
jgi:hypothetical protein